MKLLKQHGYLLIWGFFFGLATMAITTATPVAAQEISAVALPYPVGIAEIIFVSVLVILACWKKEWLRLLLAICIIIWGVFASEYLLLIGIPLIVIGCVLFFLALFKVWRGRELVEG